MKFSYFILFFFIRSLFLQGYEIKRKTQYYIKEIIDEENIIAFAEAFSENPFLDEVFLVEGTPIFHYALLKGKYKFLSYLFSSHFSLSKRDEEKRTLSILWFQFSENEKERLKEKDIELYKCLETFSQEAKVHNRSENPYTIFNHEEFIKRGSNSSFLTAALLDFPDSFIRAVQNKKINLEEMITKEKLLENVLDKDEDKILSFLIKNKYLKIDDHFLFLILKKNAKKCFCAFLEEYARLIHTRTNEVYDVFLRSCNNNIMLDSFFRLLMRFHYLDDFSLYLCQVAVFE